MEAAERPLTGKVAGKVETDLFCAECGYNLHMLDVIRDERLGIAVARCPECGKYHPAGYATGAGRVWLNRLAGLLLAIWVLFLLAAVVALGFACAGLDAAKIEGFIYNKGMPVPDHAGNQDWQWQWSPSAPEDSQGAWLMFLGNSLINTGSLALGFLGGMVMVTFLPHLKRRTAVWLVLMPSIALGFVSLSYYVDREHYEAGMVGFFVWRLGLEFVLQCLGIAAGARFGRSVARGMLRVALSRRLLQYVRKVWEVDGKVPPAAKTN